MKKAHSSFEVIVLSLFFVEIPILRINEGPYSTALLAL